MAYPPLVSYQTENEYRSHYERVYCQGIITTFDGIAVRFRKSLFNHCFYESSKRNNEKDVFSIKRSERIDWIKAALQDSTATLHVGWDRKKKKYDRNRRVALVVGNYVVVIRLQGTNKAQFVTAYVADSSFSLSKIKGSPQWTPFIT